MNSFKLLLKPTLAHDKTLNFLLLCQTAATVLSAGLVVLTQQHPAAQSTVTTIPLLVYTFVTLLSSRENFVLLDLLDFKGECFG